MITLELSLNSYQSAHRFVEMCELNFEKELEGQITSVLEENTKIITLSGPTCSGKTTTAKKLINQIEQSGLRAHVISIDDFYRDNIREDKNCMDWDSAAALDLGSFDRFVTDLLTGKTARKPIFDLGSGRISGYEDHVFTGEDIFVFEGIQAVYPEITHNFKDVSYSSIFVSVPEDVVLNGVYFDRHEIRLIRRLVRDVKFRNTSFETTFRIWNSVRENEKKNIYPNVNEIRYKINSFMPYELLIIGKYLLPLAENIKEDFKGYDLLTSIVTKLKKVTNEYVTEDMISRRSVFREFIG